MIKELIWNIISLLRANHFFEGDDNSTGKFSMGIALFNIGVAIGYRIARDEKKRQEGRP